MINKQLQVILDDESTFVTVMLPIAYEQASDEDWGLKAAQWLVANPAASNPLLIELFVCEDNFLAKEPEVVELAEGADLLLTIFDTLLEDTITRIVYVKTVYAVYNFA